MRVPFSSQPALSYLSPAPGQSRKRILVPAPPQRYQDKFVFRGRIRRVSEIEISPSKSFTFDSLLPPRVPILGSARETQADKMERAIAIAARLHAAGGRVFASEEKLVEQDLCKKPRLSIRIYVGAIGIV